MRLRIVLVLLLLCGILAFCQNDIFAQNPAPDTWSCVRYDTLRELVAESDFIGADFYRYYLKKLEAKLVFPETTSKSDKEKALKELKDDLWQCWSDNVTT